MGTAVKTSAGPILKELQELSKWDLLLLEEVNVLLKVPRQHNMYTFDMKNVDSSKGYTCLLAKSSSDDAKLWQELGHLIFKNLNTLVKGNLVEGYLPEFHQKDHTCVACQKKATQASCKAKIETDILTHPYTLAMELIGPTSVRSITSNYCLVITDKLYKVLLGIFLAKKDVTRLRRMQTSTSLTGATRKAAVSEKLAKKKTHSHKQPSSTLISKSVVDELCTFRKILDAQGLKHLGQYLQLALPVTKSFNTGSDNLTTVVKSAVTPYGKQRAPLAQDEGGIQQLVAAKISWKEVNLRHCKKQTIVATSTTEAEYVAAASCCGQVLWLQNQLLDYGFNFMNTIIHIDNQSTICIIKNPVYHSKTKHIEIRHHFIRDLL
ncbi:hypothetical protein Tco_1055752 [Tanacetum coccineum]|uniref:GAG-pre-integrase domain-containing protein n=1 Tax=Tanacetum coccineum TaxID=301880 RepID=A0ABQ5H0K1_9ASTR